MGITIELILFALAPGWSPIEHSGTMYALLNKISWASENGIEFNQNTTAQVDREKMDRDRKVIKSLAKQLQL